MQENQDFYMDSDQALGDETRVFLPHVELFEACQVGDEILLNDGVIVLRCVDKKQRDQDFSLKSVVVSGGVLSDRKGVSVPNRVVKTEFPTKSDLISIQTALKLKIDILMISFVQTADDVRKVRKLTNSTMHLMAKIEMPTAVHNLEEICQVSDSILVARGDLGVEARLSRIGLLQKKVISEAKKQQKQVFVATQFLESLVHSQVPTYSECNDVGNAVLDGADGILLTGETANGCNPLNAIQWLEKLITGVGA